MLLLEGELKATYYFTAQKGPTSSPAIFESDVCELGRNALHYRNIVNRASIAPHLGKVLFEAQDRL